MTTAHDNFADFQVSQRDSDLYPKNLLRAELWEHTLEEYHTRLEASGSDDDDDTPELFDDEYTSIYTLDFSERSGCQSNSSPFRITVANSIGCTAFVLSKQLTKLDELTSLMNIAEKDPRCRYMYVQLLIQESNVVVPQIDISRFIHAQSSRYPLGCSKKQLLHILTYYQVTPCFLEHVFTFCARDEPHMRTSFRTEDYLSLHDQPLQLGQLGRSGIQLQHCFNLVGVEHDKEANWPYLYRQTAAYYSFDIIEGKSVWILIKANNVIRKRIQQSTESTQRRRNLRQFTSAEASFSSGLSTHLLIYEWSVENWTGYIDFLELKVQEYSGFIKYSPVTGLTQEKELAQALSKRPTWQGDKMPRQNSGFSQRFQRRTSSFGKMINAGTRAFSDKLPLKLKKSSVAAASAPPQPTKVKVMDELNLDEIFSFNQLQNLHRLAAQLERAMLVIKQNKRVLLEMLERFTELRGSTDFANRMRVDDINFQDFFRRTRRCLSELENQGGRLETLQAGLDKDVALVSQSAPTVSVNLRYTNGNGISSMVFCSIRTCEPASSLPGLPRYQLQRWSS
jgi:hypothetical protein